MSCNHDWFDHYMMYSAMSGGNKGGGDDWGCLIILLEAIGGTVLMGAIVYMIGSIFGCI